MSPANWLTLLRIVLIPVFVTALIYRHMDWALGIFILAAVTDALDGYVARRTETTALGRFLDPTADKLLLVSAFVLLPILDGIPLWVSVVVVSRDVFLALGYLILVLTLGSSARIRVRPLGKVTTLLQSVCVGWVLLADLLGGFPLLVRVVAATVAVVTAASAVDYFIQGFRDVNTAHEKSA